MACRDWQNEWGIAQNWQKLDFRNIKLKLNSIQNKDREEAVFSLTLAVIKARTVNGTIGQGLLLSNFIPIYLFFLKNWFKFLNFRDKKLKAMKM